MRADVKRLAPYAVFAVIGSLHLVPLALSDRPYVDDLRRSLSGGTGWVPNARPLSDVAMVLFNAGYPLADLAPLTQIVAGGLVLLSSVLLFRWTSGLSMPPIWRALACSAVLLNPFILQNFAYRFDSFPMALAFFSCVWAAAPRDDRIHISALKTAGFVFVGLCLYQAAANVTAALAILLFAVDACSDRDPRKIWSDLVARMGGFAFAALAYALTLGSIMVGSPYTRAHSERVPATLEGLQTIVSNFVRASEMVWSSFDAFQVWFLAASALCAVLAVVFLAGRRAGGDGARWPLFLAVLVALPVLWLTPLGLSGALQSPVWEPRVLMAFGVVLAFALLFAAEGLFALRGSGARIFRPLTSAALVVAVAFPIMICLTAGYAFGIAQARQNEADFAVLQGLRAGFAELGVDGSFVFAVDGRQPFAPAALPTIRRFPLLRSLVPIYLREGSIWATGLLKYSGIPVTYDPERASTAIAETKGRAAAYSGLGFSLTLAGKAVVLRFSQ